MDTTSLSFDSLGIDCKPSTEDEFGQVLLLLSLYHLPFFYVIVIIIIIIIIIMCVCYVPISTSSTSKIAGKISMVFYVIYARTTALFL